MSTKGKPAVAQYIIEDIIWVPNKHVIMMPEYIGSEDDFTDEDCENLLSKLEGKKCRLKIEVIEDEELIEVPE